LKQILACDQQRQAYPYLTLLLLFRAGQYESAVTYAQQSYLEDVRSFGTLIAKYARDFKQQLPIAEISQFFTIADQVQGNNYDICRDALLHLMTGCTFEPVYEDLFF
jgi:hypothetical protein